MFINNKIQHFTKIFNRLFWIPEENLQLVDLRDLSENSQCRGNWKTMNRYNTTHGQANLTRARENIPSLLIPVECFSTKKKKMLNKRQNFGINYCGTIIISRHFNFDRYWAVSMVPRTATCGNPTHSKYYSL